jgi:hypothetical protein
MTCPSPEIASAWEYRMVLGGVGMKPSPIMPVGGVQRKAWVSPGPEVLLPTMVDPSPEIPVAKEPKTPPGRSPSGVKAEVLIEYRNASLPESDSPVPAMNSPSPETARAEERGTMLAPPGRSPIMRGPVALVQMYACVPSGLK